MHLVLQYIDCLVTIEINILLLLGGVFVLLDIM